MTTATDTTSTNAGYGRCIGCQQTKLLDGRGYPRPHNRFSYDRSLRTRRCPGENSPADPEDRPERNRKPRPSWARCQWCHAQLHIDPEPLEDVDQPDRCGQTSPRVGAGADG
jgi:hypothetical protein